MALDDFCRRHRHEPVTEQHAALCRRINGHINYFASVITQNRPPMIT
jgi:hypothetical protein